MREMLQAQPIIQSDLASSNLLLPAWACKEHDDAAWAGLGHRRSLAGFPKAMRSDDDGGDPAAQVLDDLQVRWQPSAASRLSLCNFQRACAGVAETEAAQLSL